MTEVCKKCKGEKEFPFKTKQEAREFCRRQVWPYASTGSEELGTVTVRCQRCEGTGEEPKSLETTRWRKRPVLCPVCKRIGTRTPDAVCRQCESLLSKGKKYETEIEGQFADTTFVYQSNLLSDLTSLWSGYRRMRKEFAVKEVDILAALTQGAWTYTHRQTDGDYYFDIETGELIENEEPTKESSSYYQNYIRLRVPYKVGVALGQLAYLAHTNRKDLKEEAFRDGASFVKNIAFGKVSIGELNDIFTMEEKDGE